MNATSGGILSRIFTGAAILILFVLLLSPLLFPVVGSLLGIKDLVTCLRR
jgi:hypothetical protein